MDPSWPQLVGRNLGAAMVPCAGRMTCTTPESSAVLDFWHGGAGRWRVEHGGEVQYISDGDRACCRDESGALVTVRGRRGILMAWLTTGVGPFDLIGQAGILHKMSQNVVAMTAPAAVIHDGRPGWATQLGAPGAAEADRILVTIDDESGVIVELTSARGGSIGVTGLTTEAVSDDHFAWASDESEPEPISDQQRILERLEILSAIDAALQRRGEILAAVEDARSIDEAHAAVAELLGAGQVAVDAVLALQLRRFTHAERGKIAAEAADLRKIASTTQTAGERNR